MPDVQAPDGTVVNFPDTMSSDDIGKVMQQHFPVGGSGHADDSYWNDLKSSAGGVMNAAGNLANDVGATSTGQWLHDNAPAPAPGYQNRGTNTYADLKAGNYSKAAGDLAHGVAGGSAQSLATLGAGALGGALGGPVGAAAGAGLASGALSYGEHGNLGEAALDGTIGGLTMGRVPGGALVRPLARGALMGAGGAAQSAGDQAIEKGSVDPDQVANAALTGAATGVAAEAPGAARAVTSAAGRRGMELTRPTPSDPQATLDANDLYTDARQKADPNAPDKAVIASTVEAQRAKLHGMIAQGLQDGTVTPDQATVMHIQSEDAANHTRALIDNGNLDQNGTMPDWARQAKATDVLSRSRLYNQQTGPLRFAGGLAGQLAPLAAAVPLGPGALAGAVGNAVLGRHGPGAKIGASLGGMADRAFGTNYSPLELDAANAQRALGKNAAPSITDAPADPVTGNTPDPVPVNTPIRGSLKPNTRADVRSAVSQDDSGPAVASQEPVGGVQPSLATQVAPVAAAAQAGSLQGLPQTGWEKYVANGRPLTRQAIHDAVDQTLPPDYAAQVKAHPGGIPAANLQPVIDALAGKGPTKGADQSGISNIWAYRHNLQQEGDAYASVPPDLKSIADTVRNPALNGKTKAGRRMVLDMAKSAHPDPDRLEQHIGPLTGYGQG